MADDYDPGMKSRPFGSQDDTATAVSAPPEYDPGGPGSKSPLSTSYKKVPSNEHGAGIPWDSYEYPGGGNVAPDILGTISGDSSVRHPEIPALGIPGLGLGVTDPKAWGVVANMALSRDPAALERAIQARIPDAKFSWDDTAPDGSPAAGANRTVQVPGGPMMYLDRPGMTPQKGLFYGPQTLAAVASGGRSLPAQMGLGGVQHGLSTAGSYVAGGASSPLDPLGTALSTLMPGVFGAVGAGAIKGYDWLTSEVAPPAADVIKRLGVQGLSVAEQAAAVVADRARTLYRWGFAGKPGDLTRDPAQLAREDLAANAGWPATRAKMAEFHESNAQQTLLQKRLLIGQNAGDIPPGAKAPPDNYFPNESTFGNRINDAVIAREKALMDAKAKASIDMGDISPTTPAGRSVEWSPEVSADILPQARKLLNDRYGAPQGPNGTYTSAQLGESGPALVNAVDQMRRIMQPGDNAKFNPAPFQPFNLGHYQDLRQVVGRIMDETMPGTPGYAAAGRLKGILDGGVETALITPGRVAGTPEQLAKFKDLNAATRDYYAFRHPDDNEPAAAFVNSVLNKAAPATGQETVSKVLGGGGTVTPGGGTNAILTHLQTNLGDDATKPLAGATTMRSLYGTKGTTEEGGAAPSRFDYDSTANRIHSQIAGTGDDVASRLLSPEARARMGDFRDALNILGASNRKTGPRQNAPGSGYIGMMTSQLPGGLGSIVDKLRLMHAANEATRGGAELVARAQAGANTARELQIRLPRQSTIQNPDPQNPFYSWQPEAWRAGTPLYRGGGLLGSEALDPANRP